MIFSDCLWHCVCVQGWEISSDCAEWSRWQRGDNWSSWGFCKRWQRAKSYHCSESL